MSEKIIIVTESYYSFPLILELEASNRLKKVLLTEQSAMYVSQLSLQIPKERIMIIKDPSNPLKDIEYTNTCLVYGYSHKITHLRSTMLNIHFGPLPENKGPDPVFWTLKQGKALAYVCIHEVSDSIDSGKIYLEKSIEIYPQETYGMLSTRLSVFSIEVVNELLSASLEPREQDPTSEHVYGSPSDEDITIDWSQMNSSEIQNLVNACNPKYGGSHTLLNNQPVKLIEVSTTHATTAIQPGSILKNSGEDLLVGCSDGLLLKIDIISIPEGIVSGQKLAHQLPLNSRFT